MKYPQSGAEEESHSVLAARVVLVRRPPIWPDLALLIVCGSLLLVELFLPPLIGLANNGDFGKILGRLSLGVDTSKNLLYFVSKYQYSNKYAWNSHLPTSELLLTAAALRISGTSQQGQEFDIRYLSLLHAVLLIAAFYVFLTLLRNFPVWMRLAVGLLGVWIFTDVAYTAYFSSFLSDTAAFLGLLLTIVLGLHVVCHRELGWSAWLAFAGATLLLTTAKAQHALCGIFAAALAMSLSFSSRSKFHGYANGLLCVVLLTATWLELRSTAQWYKAEAMFDIVFDNIPKEFPDIRQELRELDLPLSYAADVNGHVFTEDRHWLLQFYSQARFSSVFKFYLTHPRTTLGIMMADVRTSAAELRTLPNYRQEDGFPPRTMARHFCSWSDLRHRLYLIWPGHIIVWLLIVACGAIWELSTTHDQSVRGAAAICAAVVAMAILEFSIASLGDGNDTARHLFLFHALTDITVCFAAVYLAKGFAAEITRRRLERLPGLGASAYPREA